MTVMSERHVNTQIELDAGPATGPIDERRHIHVRGLPPRTRVALRAFLLDARGAPWASRVSLDADINGSAFMDCDELTSSMTIAGERAARPFDGASITPIRMEIAVEISGRIVAATQISHRYLSDDVRRTELSGRNRSGLLFEPAAGEPRPGVIVVGGSSGGLSFAAQTAALLAGHGFTTMALAYFAYGFLPPHLVQIPLEYFLSAVEWFSALPSVQKESVGLMGISRGAELALLLASRTPHVRAVVAYSPSSYVWSGLRADSPSDAPAWATTGTPIPFASLTVPRLANVRERVFASSPIELTPMFETALAGPLPADAMIPVEKTNGPILLVSGEDDRMWPATPMGEQVMHRLAARAHPFHSRHLHYPNAGHSMRAPGVSTQILHGKFAFGGEPRAQAQANRASWTETVSFLGETLGLRRTANGVAATGGQPCR
jgi:dienelactone hydrolase